MYQKLIERNDNYTAGNWLDYLYHQNITNLLVGVLTTQVSFKTAPFTKCISKINSQNNKRQCWRFKFSHANVKSDRT